MRCPDCETNIEIEDWQDDKPFDCPECGTPLRLEIDESTYLGATDTRLVVVDPD